MCLLTFLMPAISPDLDALANGAAMNPDGHGYALITGNTLTTGHGLDPDVVIDEFAELRARYSDGPALFHSRLATHGDTDLSNCHPFAVGGNQRTALAHNGTLPAKVHPVDGDPRCDTRITAEDYLPGQPFGSLDSWVGRHGFERWLGDDKMVLLSVDPDYKHRAYIFNEHYGHWADGIWYSNETYQLNDWSRHWDCCACCGEFDPDPIDPFCASCGFCGLCWRAFPACICPVPDDADLALETN